MVDDGLLRKFSLPESAVNSQEIRYDPRDDVWPVSSSGTKNIDLSRYREDCTALFLQSLKLALVTLNRRLKPTSLTTYLRAGLNPLLEGKTKPCGEITQTDLEAYWFTLPPNRKYWISSLKPVCEALALHGIPGHCITPGALEYLRNLNPGGCFGRGEATRTWDPVRGPMTPDELDALLRALHAGFVRAEISEEDYILILLFASFGARTANLADLRVCDLTITQDDELPSYQLHIPRVKQQGVRFRAAFYTRHVVPELGTFLEEYIALQKERHAGLGLGNQLPLFVDLRNSDPVRPYHRGTSQISEHAVTTSKRLAIPCQRTGTNMRVNSRRYRSTVGTMARAMGLDPSAIAELLDHGDTRTQEVYAAIGPEVLAGITQRLQGFRGPLAGAFLGRMGEPGEVAEPQHLIFRPQFRKDRADSTVGGCEASRRCAGRRPFACYLCNLFTASMEGDHEGALADVVEERVRFGTHAGNDLQYLTADSVADAIRAVITMRDRRLNEMGKDLTQIRLEKKTLLHKRGIIT